MGSVLIRKTGSTRFKSGRRDYPCKHPLCTQCLYWCHHHFSGLNKLRSSEFPQRSHCHSLRCFHFWHHQLWDILFKLGGCTGMRGVATCGASGQPSLSKGCFFRATVLGVEAVEYLLSSSLLLPHKRAQVPGNI